MRLSGGRMSRERRETGESNPPAMSRKAPVSGGEEAEVEALLRAAQDAVLLKLQANSHLVSATSAPTAPSLDAAAAPDPLESNLARRFEALKSRPLVPAPKAAGAGAAGGSGGMEELGRRFAALKGTAGPEKETRVRLEDLGGESSEDEEEEVDKLMRWAMDAARLDVATAGAGTANKAKGAEGEEAKDEEGSPVSSEDDEDEEELEMARKRKEMARSKSKNKWFFF